MAITQYNDSELWLTSSGGNVTEAAEELDGCGNVEGVGLSTFPTVLPGGDWTVDLSFFSYIGSA
jgi:hypothetical protein